MADDIKVTDSRLSTAKLTIDEALRLPNHEYERLFNGPERSEFADRLFEAIDVPILTPGSTWADLYYGHNLTSDQRRRYRSLLARALSIDLDTIEWDTKPVVA